MSKSMRIIIIGVVIALAAGAVFLKEGNKDAGADATPGSVATLSDEKDVAGHDEDVAGVAQDRKLPRLVDLGASKCVPCKMMEPILEELKHEYDDDFTVEFIDVQEERDKAAEYGVRVIPTQIFYDAKGNELYRHEGFFSKEGILDIWKKHGVALEQTEEE